MYVPCATYTVLKGLPVTGLERAGGQHVVRATLLSGMLCRMTSTWRTHGSVNALGGACRQGYSGTRGLVQDDAHTAQRENQS